MSSVIHHQQIFWRLSAAFRRFLNDERGYYYVELKEDEQGKKKVTIESGIIYMLIACTTILFLTVLILGYKSNTFPLAIVFLITVSFLVFLTIIIVAIKSKRGFSPYMVLLVMLALCLGILGFHIKDIVDVLTTLSIK